MHRNSGPSYHREPKPAPLRHRERDHSAQRHSHHSPRSAHSPRNSSQHTYELEDNINNNNYDGSQNPRHSTHSTRLNTHNNHHSHPPSKSNHHHHRHIGTITGHFVAASGEFVGTLMFLYFAFACQIMLTQQAGEKSLDNGENKNRSVTSSQQNIFTALVYGFSLLVNAWAFYRISGGLFNPAVTLALVLTGAVPFIRGLFLLPAQLLGAMSAAALVKGMFPGSIDATNTSLSPGTTIAQGVFIEMFMTAELVFVVLMLAVEKSKDTFLAPIGVGLALFVAMMGGVGYTGGSLNPARSLGPAVASRHFVGHHWIYWVGPFLGALLAAGYYKFVKYFHYEEVNPGQDHANERDV